MAELMETCRVTQGDGEVQATSDGPGDQVGDQDGVPATSDRGGASRVED